MKGNFEFMKTKQTCHQSDGVTHVSELQRERERENLINYDQIKWVELKCPIDTNLDFYRTKEEFQATMPHHVIKIQ